MKGISYVFLQRRVIVEYREKIIEMVNEIDCEDILEYLYIFIRGKIGCFQNEENK